MIDTLKRVFSRKQTWVTIAGVATSIPFFVSGNAAQGIQTIIASIFGAN